MQVTDQFEWLQPFNSVAQQLGMLRIIFRDVWMPVKND